MTKKKDFLDVISENRFIHILLSIILGFLVGAIFLAVMGLSVGEAYGRLISSVTSLKGFSYVIVYAIPYIVVGLSVAFSFKTGVFNIGAEGQFVVGSMAAAVVGILLGNLPKPILILLCFLAAMAAGAVWGIIVGFLKTSCGDKSDNPRLRSGSHHSPGVQAPPVAQVYARILLTACCTAE
ncbi:MAG: ABC transporter permease [Oscillospiraceae bacterium]|nr:ABC transporter permease [Acidaminococcaceae bacterium]MBQ9250257.1 ABC transporter permease [Oscillospiraceae bacterium]